MKLYLNTSYYLFLNRKISLLRIRNSLLIIPNNLNDIMNFLNVIMKKLILIGSLFIGSILYGQDTIVKTNRESIPSKILEVGVEEISYRRIDNLEGPLFIISKKNVSKLIFENGNVLTIEEDENDVEMSLEKTKEQIVEYINKFGFVWKQENPIHAEFENNLLRLTQINRRTGEHFPYSKLYDFTVNCDFHALSLRGGVGYINVFPDIVKGKKRERGYKLVIGVRGPDNAEVLYAALKRFNKSFGN